MAKDQFWILALSGGGARGLFTAKILEQIEAEIGCPIAQKFDLIAGTSIGGILALGLANEIPATKLVALFDQVSDIFKPRNCFLPNWGLFKPIYRNRCLKQLLEQTFGNAIIGDLKHRIVIPSINYTKGEPGFFKTPHDVGLYRDWSRQLVDVGMATAAAPVFFPIYSFDSMHFVDGGLVANAPGLIAVHEAMRFAGHPDVETIHVVAIGTAARGTAMNAGVSDDMGVLSVTKRGFPWVTAGWRRRLFELTINAQEAMSNSMLKHWIGDRYHLIDSVPRPEQTNYLALDDVSAEARETLLGQANVAGQTLLTTSFLNQLREHEPGPVRFFHGPNKNVSE